MITTTSVCLSLALLLAAACVLVSRKLKVHILDVFLLLLLHLAQYGGQVLELPGLQRVQTAVRRR